MPLGCLVKMWLAQIHAVTGDGAGYSADEGDGSVLLDLLDNADVCQRIIQQTISIEIPGVIKEHQITWVDVLIMMKHAMLTHMVVDEADAVRIHLGVATSIEVNPVLQKDGSCHSRTVIVDTPTLDGDGL